MLVLVTNLSQVQLLNIINIEYFKMIEDEINLCNVEELKTKSSVGFETLAHLEKYLHVAYRESPSKLRKYLFDILISLIQ